jgi:hypothetical protein
MRPNQLRGGGNMMKKMMIFTFLLLFIVSACSKQEVSTKKDELSRIDVRKINEVITITDKETLTTMTNSFDHVKWQPNVEAEMARKEDLLVTLFYRFDKNLPERLYTYRIWFNVDDTATIISDNTTQGYGSLAKDHTEAIKRELLKLEKGKKAEEITVYKLDEESKQFVISDQDAIITIKNAIKSATKQPGIVDMANPQYKIHIGDEIYFLWLSMSDGAIGTIMNFKDTHTIYTFSKKMTNELKNILPKENN